MADIRGPYTDLFGRDCVPFPAQYKQISKVWMGQDLDEDHYVFHSLQHHCWNDHN
ncbi:hypothetical protein MTR_5g089345 [Medicago truncatula]|uniref:Uncharacterized protein n=1 Tax=Medicago truncatula TaxID=3880 RepID=A0A072UG55_MEDTR|nr:hypothetical protein MTR_5g089345 [Medicago truncatula]